MPAFVVLGRYTDEGRAAIKDSPARLDQARKVLQKLGGDITDLYLTIGPHDFVAIVQAPNDDLVAKFILAVGAQGYVRTTTLKAYPEAEYRRLISGAGETSPRGVRTRSGAGRSPRRRARATSR
jgi:uncharacterized protein with GYD domain